MFPRAAIGSNVIDCCEYRQTPAGVISSRNVTANLTRGINYTETRRNRRQKIWRHAPVHLLWSGS